MKRVLILLACLSQGGAALAADTWSNPAPGVERLHRRTGNQSIHVLRVDLCTPGVSFRGTAPGERGQRVSAFGASVGATAAINGDFFGAGYSTDGPSMGAGQAWGGVDHGYVSPIAFGDARVDLPHHVHETGLQPWMREVVSGHPTILDDGSAVPSDDPLCTHRHPRTAVGITQDHRQVILAVVDGRRADRIGMTCAELAGLMAEFGAFDAVNMDGGGSSTLWLAGAGVLNSPSDGNERTVGSHLAVLSTGSGAAPHCPDHLPTGWLDGASCSGVGGWAWDADTPDQPVDVHVYLDGPAGDPHATGLAVRADLERADLCSALGSCSHGFHVALPPAFHDGRAHAVYAYAIGGPNPLLQGAPTEFRCFGPPPLDPHQGVLRHVGSPDVMAAWAWSMEEVAVLPPAQVAAYPTADGWPAAPALVAVPGEPEVWLVDGPRRRHVPSPDAMAAWRLDWNAIAPVEASVRDAWVLGPPLPSRPFLLRGDGPAVFVLDRAPEAPTAAPADAGAADTSSRSMMASVDPASSSGSASSVSSSSSSAPSSHRADGAVVPGASSSSSSEPAVTPDGPDAGPRGVPLETQPGESAAGCSTGAARGWGAVWGVLPGLAWRARRRVRGSARG